MSTLISCRLMGTLLNCTQSGRINISYLELKFVFLIQMVSPNIVRVWNMRKKKWIGISLPAFVN